MPFVTHENDVVYLDANGDRMAEITFPSTGDDTVEIDHTFVDGSLRGQGIAGQLMEHAVTAIRETGRKAHPTCSYAVAWFEKHPDQSDLLV